jgi:pilus assembly protein CpaE
VPSRILVVEADAPAGDVIAGILTGVGHTVSMVETGEDALRSVADHELVIVDVVRPPGDPLGLCREIRRTPALAAIPVLCICQSDDVEERIRFLEAGADDVIAKPFDARELEARVEALLLRFQRTKDLAPLAAAHGDGIGSRRRIVVVYSPKGGVGTTTIATNLALATAQQHADRVAIVDLDLQFGQVTTHLNVTPRQTIVELVRDEPALAEPELLRTYATRHDSGLHVIAAPPSPEYAELVTGDHVGRLLSTITGTYDYVVVDGGSILDDRTMTAFEHASTLVIPVCPEIAALKAVHSLLDYLNETTSVGAKASFVLNHLFAREIVKLRDVEATLGARVTTELPYDAFLYQKAVNEGIPVVAGAPRSAPAERLAKLAATLFGVDGAVPSPAAAEPRRAGLLGRLRKA